MSSDYWECCCSLGRIKKKSPFFSLLICFHLYGCVSELWLSLHLCVSFWVHWSSRLSHFYSLQSLPFSKYLRSIPGEIIFTSVFSWNANFSLSCYPSPISTSSSCLLLIPSFVCISSPHFSLWKLPSQTFCSSFVPLFLLLSPSVKLPGASSEDQIIALLWFYKMKSTGGWAG